MSSTEKLDTHHKALTLNLDASAFGSFAEIGAGQEVAHWFFVVGGASGMVAKTISAYDKQVSDDLYGSGSRWGYPEPLEGPVIPVSNLYQTSWFDTHGISGRRCCQNRRLRARQQEPFDTTVSCESDFKPTGTALKTSP